ncbi:CRISPR-associated endonuclease Cas2 [Pectinatus haikarae]|uniref:CRISPR-associated endoribonuclease Cas2 n=1 Tax=Pectinatus haikarae TaxID=349096 RepID=A0ABT9Y9Y1_9FIRM|nr:CRISPR-associated endonuclease Cas2 [Pectinatus haikarae]MDQ0204448.1 CRISPR-associated protein Cas2 [Pectinatus haikarae]
MFVLITYDISTVDEKGKRRLRKVAKICVNFGQRVQNSVFECKIDPAQCKKIEIDLEKIIDPKQDSLRFYYLGSSKGAKVKHIGVRVSYDIEGPIII